MAKKKKREREAEALCNAEKQVSEIEVELVNGDSHNKKKKKKKKEIKGGDDEAQEIPTVSIAVSGSIIDNAQSFELATRVLSLSLPSPLSLLLSTCAFCLVAEKIL